MKLKIEIENWNRKLKSKLLLQKYWSSYFYLRNITHLSMVRNVLNCVCFSCFFTSKWVIFEFRPVLKHFSKSPNIIYYFLFLIYSCYIDFSNLSQRVGGLLGNMNSIKPQSSTLTLTLDLGLRPMVCWLKKVTKGKLLIHISKYREKKSWQSHWW